MKSFNSLFSFGSKLLLASLLSTIYQNIYVILIGKVYSAKDLGFYTRAHQFQQFPSKNISSIISRVTFPVLSSIQDDHKRLIVAYRKFIKLSAFIVFPLMIGLAVTAEPLIKVVLTDKWLPAAPMLQLLCIAGMLYPIHAINLNILNVKGRSDLFLKLEIAKKIIFTLIILFTYSYGINILILGQILASIIAFFINTYFTDKMVGYGALKQIIDMLPMLLISVIMGIVVWGGMKYFVGDLVKLCTGILIGITSYILFAKLGRLEELSELKKLFRRNK